MSVDKKADGGRLRFILLERLGAAVIRADVAPEALRATLDMAVTA
jgi:3-dehydroquinate synthase